MPSINRIRVNNVKYNFGTQQYDDFTMRMYGRNTLYDLANGGGKSVLMLLLLQNLIPNCTLDEKQPIEKLFRTGGGNTVIHSLIEWKLDEADIKDGYRYMTTGFCARKAKDAADGQTAGPDKDTAQIEYFNYCIFYREYNRNDIVNLPLSEGNERITYSGLRSYLKELGHRDMSLEVRVFDRKGEYQRFISGYGLHESHWEIIRGINKTEGHVRTYFETNYRTTRKVVEDLLIEEIIEKATATKTGTSGEDDTMAQTLLGIKDKLNVLAQRKRDIANYDHQIELTNVLLDKVNSCIGLYGEHDGICRELADIYVTGCEHARQGKVRMEELAAAKEEAKAQLDEQGRKLANLKITRDCIRLDEMKRELSEADMRLAENEKKLAELREQISYRESVNDYLIYRVNRSRYEENRLIIEKLRSKSGASHGKMAAYAAERHRRDAKRLAALAEKLVKTQTDREKCEAELERVRKLVHECEIAQAVTADNISDAADKTEKLSARIGELARSENLLMTNDIAQMTAAARYEDDAVLSEMTELEIGLADMRQKLYEDRYALAELEAEYAAMELARDEAASDAETYRSSGGQLESMKTVYAADSIEELQAAINGRMRNAIEETIRREQETVRLTSLDKCYEDGRPFPPSQGASAVIDYISTRHGFMAVHGADYLAALPDGRKNLILAAHPYLPYGVVTKGYDELTGDINLGQIDTGSECVCVYDMDRLGAEGADEADAISADRDGMTESADIYGNGAGRDDTPDLAAHGMSTGYADMSAHSVRVRYADTDTSDSVLVIGRERAFFTSQDALTKLRRANQERIRTLAEETELINEKVGTYQEDMAFVMRLVDERYVNAEDREREIKSRLVHKKDELNELSARIRETEAHISTDTDRYGELQMRQQRAEGRQQTFAMIEQLNDMLRPEEQRLDECRQRKTELEARLMELRAEESEAASRAHDAAARADGIQEETDDIQRKWEEYFAPYMPSDDTDTTAISVLEYADTASISATGDTGINATAAGAPDVADAAASVTNAADIRKQVAGVSDEQLEREFMAMLAVAREHEPDIEDKQKLMDALEESMDRIQRTIEKRGHLVETFDEMYERAESQDGGGLYRTGEDAMRQMDDEAARLTRISAQLADEEKNIRTACSRLEGSIEYAVADIEKSQGVGSFVREDVSAAETDAAIAHGDEVLADMKRALAGAEQAYGDYYRQHGFMVDLFKDVKRIVDSDGIDVTEGHVMEGDAESLRQTFENSLLRYDRSRKALERARNEIMRFTGQTADTLAEMGVYEMAETIRRDMQAPQTYGEAKELLSNLNQITEFIRLEKERVEKGIEDMVAIKENFESQCIQRCMDVRTDLEKLPKLSKITLDGEEIRMVELSIPYVKDEYIRQRMSDYIDEVASGADAYEDERKRVRYIRDCLALKKLFGVMVTDMNAIRLNLYKRERIREQSRYLKYEEAVGSTGQSQGIYIQFLVAIINYISGMYSLAPENGVTSKTIFIDNPFGAAKDIYIWEPIFAMLAANNVQLIVPARGATPAITGRFDVNYVLGQQMVGGRQQTVVVDYTSRTRQEELEYRELSYEQATFDFI